MDMLTFSKEREPDLSDSDLNRVVGDVIELVQGRAGDLDVDVEWEAEAEMPTLVFDPEGLHRAVLNVVTNAIDAACKKEGRGRVRVQTDHAPAEGLVRVTVTDDGDGIPPEEIDKVFRPFVSFKGGRGTGLGLPVSQKILNEHGGKILVDSTPGRGSRFTLEMPAVLPDAAPKAPATSEHPSG